KSGSSSTMSTVGLSTVSLLLSTVSFMNSCLPPSWVCEHQAENAAASGPCLVKQGRTIGLRELACQEQAQPRAAAAPQERLEDPFRVLRRHTRSPVRDFQE